MTREIVNQDQKDTRQEWRTPRKLGAALVAEYRLNLDVAASTENALTRHYLNEQIDALSMPWTGRFWCNPPFRLASAFLAWREEQSAEGVFLLPANTDPRWFHRYILGSAGIWFFRGRVQFEPPPGVVTKSGAGFPSMLAVFDRDTPKTLLGSRCPKTGAVLERLTDGRPTRRTDPRHPAFAGCRPLSPFDL